MNTTIKLLASYDMGLSDWEQALMTAFNKGHVRLVSSGEGFGLQLANVTCIYGDIPLLKKFEGRGQDGVEAALAEYPMNKIVGEFVNFLCREGCESTLYQHYYNALELVLNLDEGATGIDVTGDCFVDKEKQHFHIDKDTGEHYQTIHDRVKALRDGSELLDKECGFEEEYDEYCSHCECESHGKFDIRKGLVDHCSECGMPLLICSMCDAEGEGCKNCPERHLLAGMYKKGTPADCKANELVIVLGDGNSRMCFATDATTIGEALSELFNAASDIGVKTDDLIIAQSILRKKSGEIIAEN